MEVTLHTNHRRKNGRHNPRKGVGWSNRCKRYGFVDEKRIEARKARQYVRELMAHERFDDIPTRYPKDILWNFW